MKTYLVTLTVYNHAAYPKPFTALFCAEDIAALYGAIRSFVGRGFTIHISNIWTD